MVMVMVMRVQAKTSQSKAQTPMLTMSATDASWGSIQGGRGIL